MNQEEQLMQNLQLLWRNRNAALFDKMYGITTQAECVEQLSILHHNRSIIEQELKALSRLQWVEDLIRTELTT